jgi:YVTN family beta-propeller protein
VGQAVDPVYVANVDSVYGPVARVVDAVYVANLGDDTVSILDGRTRTVIATVPTRAAPAHVAWDSNTGKLYVTHQPTATVSILQPQ